MWSRLYLEPRAVVSSPSAAMIILLIFHYTLIRRSFGSSVAAAAPVQLRLEVLLSLDHFPRRYVRCRLRSLGRYFPQTKTKTTSSHHAPQEGRLPLVEDVKSRLMLSQELVMSMTLHECRRARHEMVLHQPPIYEGNDLVLVLS